jgi:hypothetical protein
MPSFDDGICFAIITSTNKRQTTMIHISQFQEGTSTLHIHLEGTLDSAHVVALKDVLQEATERTIPQVILHCIRLQSVDESGARFLRNARGQGVILLDLPITVSWKLQALDTQTKRTA